MKYLKITFIIVKAVITVPFRVIFAMISDDPKKENSKAIDTTESIIVKPESFKKGEEFENYVRKSIFTSDRFTLVRRSHNYETNADDFVESSMDPDFLFRCKKTSKEFFVEIKFRKGTFDGKYEWCKYNQLARYKKIGLEKPTFIVLGMGGKPSEPRDIALMPIEHIEYTGLFPSFLNNYLIDPVSSLVNEKLWETNQTLISKK